jgi:hypothetical protein
MNTVREQERKNSEGPDPPQLVSAGTARRIQMIFVAILAKLDRFPFSLCQKFFTSFKNLVRETPLLQFSKNDVKPFHSYSARFAFGRAGNKIVHSLSFTFIDLEQIGSYKRKSQATRKDEKKKKLKASNHRETYSIIRGLKTSLTSPYLVPRERISGIRGSVGVVLVAGGLLGSGAVIRPVRRGDDRARGSKARAAAGGVRPHPVAAKVHLADLVNGFL